MSTLKMFLTFVSSPEYRSRYATAKNNGTCIWCGQIVQEFTNAYAKLEYNCSALCEKCQSELFGGN
jgi:hypothetical protein